MAPQDVRDHSLSRLRERAGVRARTLRESSTDAERCLWRVLRNRQVGGFKFRRQHPIGRFFADFACLEAGLVVELDGSQHFTAEGAESDARRSAELRGLGFEVLRFNDREALTETVGVLERIQEWLTANNPHPNPLPQAGEGVVCMPLPPEGDEVSRVELPPLPRAGEGWGEGR